MISSRLRQCLQDSMRANGVPGVSLALLEANGTIRVEGFGVRNARTNEPVNTATIFEAASLSKPVFAFAALELCQTSRLRLDVPLATYLPKPYVEGCENLDKITLRHVLSHTTGFPNWRKGRFTKTPEPLRTGFLPGTRFSYSGEGFVYAQTVLERIVGKRCGDYMDETVLRPLGLTHSSYVWREGYEANIAVGHNKEKEPDSANPQQTANVAYSLSTTPSEYARFLQHVLQNKNEEMLTAQTTLTDELAWGLGWGLWTKNGERQFWHWGDNENHQCFVAASLTKRTGIVVMTNGERGRHCCSDVVAEYLGGPHAAFRWLNDTFYKPRVA